jgi:hypothetical protein
MEQFEQRRRRSRQKAQLQQNASKCTHPKQNLPNATRKATPNRHPTTKSFAKHGKQNNSAHPNISSA